MNHDNRVLSRLGARQLTVEEAEIVNGAIIVHTNVCTAMFTTHHRPGDGDGCNADNDML